MLQDVGQSPVPWRRPLTPPHSALGSRPGRPAGLYAKPSSAWSSPSLPGRTSSIASLTRRYPRIVRGEGCYLYDADGRRYLDACGGAFVANLGHGVTAIADAIAAQASRLGYVSGTAFTHDPVEELAAENWRALAPGDLELVYPLCSGSEAVEAALKLARQYWVEAGRSRANTKLSRSRPAYHGNTLLALSASARAHYTTVLPRLAGGGRPGSGPLPLSLRLPRCASPTVRHAPGSGGAGDPAGRGGHRRGIHRRAGGRLLHRRLGTAAGLLAAGSRALRPPRGAPRSPTRS